MENKLQIFNNPEFGQIRTLEIDGEPWFVGKDVATLLGYSNPRDAISKHVDDEDRDVVAIRDAIGRMQDTPIINESGLYSLVLCSKLPSAKKFKRWITSEVLPALRKTGSYQAKPKTAAELFAMQVQVNLEHEQRLALMEKKTDYLSDSVKQLCKPVISNDTWQNEMLRRVRSLCAEHDLNYQQFITELYKELEESAGVNLETRQKRKRERLELQGAKYAERQAVSKLSIVAEDRKLREILSGIVQNHAAALVVAKMPTA